MITVLLPWMLGAALLGSVVVFVWHLLSVRQPPELLLPTARFVPGADARAVARRPKPNDLLLLLLRAVALLAIGAALAGVRCAGGGAQYARLVYADATFDTTTAQSHVPSLDSVSVTRAAGDTIGRWQRLDLRADPGVALARVWSDVASLLTAYPSIERIELAVALPSAVESRQGWDAWRAQWPGPVRVVTREAGPAAPTRSVLLRGASPDDVVSSALVVHGSGHGSEYGWRVLPRDAAVQANDAALSPVTVARADSVRMPGDYAGVWVQWVDGRGAVRDTIAAVSAGGRTVVGPFVRRDVAPPSPLSERWQMSDASSDAAPDAAPDASPDAAARRQTAWRSIAWWSDGKPAAFARQEGRACMVDVRVEAAAGSDLLLSPDAWGLLDAIVNACSERGVASASLQQPSASDSSASSVVMAVPAERLRARVSLPPRAADMRWTWALLALAGVALLLEWRLRA
ncbi:MAG: hypothetical protein IBJ19_15180 [Gemmatimonadaceae bacterium]|nr:hypothetical protein [Gemmatimonadaceae bacterium]